MKITAVLMMIGCLHLSAASFSQSITLKVTRAPLATVLKDIQRQTALRVIYNDSYLTNAKPVTIVANNMPLEQFLSQVLEEQSLTFAVRENIIIIGKIDNVSDKDIGGEWLESTEQQRTISGEVTDESGEPLEGATVSAKGATATVTTDASGNYRIELPPGANQLSFTMVGFEPVERSLGSQSTINVSMKASLSDLDEVVVVGYGTVKKRDLTGSVSSVSSEDFNQGVITNVDQALIGKIPGVEINQTTGEPGGGMAIRIRGASSITASSDPLFVIDGMPIDNSPTINTGGGGAGIAGNTNPKNPLNTLSPSAIESIEVLKDASATAIYGARGANGVILITTKRGKEGQTKVDYDFFGSVQTTENRFDVLSTQEYMKTFNAFAEEMGQNLIFTDSDFQSIGDGTDYQDLIFRRAFVQSHNLSFSGGNKIMQYNIMGNHLNQEGLVLNNKLRRSSLQANLTSDISDRVNINLNLNVSKINDDALVNGNVASEQSGVVTAAVYYDPTLPVRDESGGFYNSTDLLLANPVAVAEGITNQIGTNRFMGSMDLTYKISDNLSTKIKLGLDQQNIRRDAFSSTKTFLGAVAGATGYIESLDRSNVLLEYTAAYNKMIGSAHDLHVVAGTTYQDFGDRRHSSFVSEFITDVLGTDNLDLGNTAQAVVGSNTVDYRLLSYFTRVNYNVLDRFLFTGTIRADGSSRFGKNNQFGYFPSLAFGWKLDEERFIPKLFNQLKLRGSWGLTGNQEIGNYVAISTYSVSGSAVLGSSQQNSAAPTRMANPDLKWEATEQYNLGIDFGILGRRISGSVDYFVKNTRDMLVSFPLPRSSGFSGQLQNIGSMTNRGLEVLFTTRNIQSNNIGWNTTLNFATLYNKVTDIGRLDRIIMGGVPESSESVSIIRKGIPLNSYYGYNIIGIYQTDEEIANSAQPNSRPGYPIYKDVDNDGVITELDKVIMGNPFPDLTFGIRNTISYKSFNLDFFIHGSFGNELFNGTAMAQAYPRTFRRNRNVHQIADRWTPDNPDAKWPSGINTSSYGPGSIVSLFVEDASFVRLKTLRLSYAIPTARIGFLRAATISVTGENLLTITNYSGLNPEASLHGRSNVQVDFTTYPLAKAVSLGVNLSF